ncbi:cytochrome c [uncultured Gimesia sp.]|uniref:cytochrome c n=1 Tax=uncultured Gimesia sp. TaxID=1678688 RepID=UPI0030DCA910|tara:strand:- start:66873 stop:67805 length:933 start_codon:yes stop_codon:yes gene_type:complete
MSYLRILIFIGLCVFATSIEPAYSQRQDAGPEAENAAEVGNRNRRFHSLSRPGLHNVFQIDDQIYSGSGPEGKQSFDALKKMGIKTIISVDGMKPDVQLAKAAGMKYVHIPIGYDGIFEDANLAFLRAAKELKGPVYIHCHHGRHRGPAAAAMVGMCRGSLDKERALLFLNQAGTSKDYAGLWRDVRQFRLPPADVVLPELVESARVEPMVTAMAHISQYYEELQKKAESDPRDEKHAMRISVLLREAFHESVRKHSDDYDDTFKKWMHESEMEVKQVEAALKQGNQKQVTASLKQLKSQCKCCHKAYRN